MALVDVEGPAGKKKPTWTGLSGSATAAVTAPASPVFQDPAVPAYSDVYAYETFAPAAGNVTTLAGPMGGVRSGIREGAYEWVDDGTPSGYWVRDDGETWQATPLTKAADKVTAFAGQTTPLGATPVTNAPVVKQQPSKDAALQAVLNKKLPSAPPTTGTTSTYTLPGGAASLPEGGLQGATWVPGDPDAFDPLARRGSYQFDTPMPATQLDIQPRGVLADLTTPLLPRSVTERTTDYLPEPLERAVEFTLSPAGLASAALSGGLSAAAGTGFARGAAADVAANVAGEALGYGAEQAGLPPWLSTAANIAGGVGGEAAFAGVLAKRGVAKTAQAGVRGAPTDSVAPGVTAPGPIRPLTPAGEINQAVRTALGEVDEVAPPPVRVAEGAAQAAPSVSPPVRTLPTPAAVASTKTPPPNLDWHVINDRPRNTRMAAIVVGGTDAGEIRRVGTGGEWEAFYRNPDGALLPVPRNAAGDPFVGTKRQAQNVVVNASQAGGRILEDVPKRPRLAVVSTDPVEREVVAAIARTPTYEQAREAARVARSPVKPGQMVEHNGGVYEVSGVVSQSGKVRLNNLDGSAAKNANGQPLLATYDEVAPVILPPARMSVRSMVRELDDFLPADARTRIYANESAWDKAQRAGKPITPEQATKVAEMRQSLEAAVLQSREVAVKRQVAQAIDSPNGRAVADSVAERMPNDMAVPGSAANGRARAAQLGSSDPVQTAIHEAQVRNGQAQLAQLSEVPSLPPGTAKSLMEEVDKAKSPRRRAAGGVVGAVTAPVTGLRDLLLAGDLLTGRQLRGTLLFDPKSAAKGYETQIRALFSPAYRKRMWAASEAYADSHPHLPLLRHKDKLSMSEEMFITRWTSKVPGLKQIEEANALALNAARMNLDGKLTAIGVKANGTLTDDALRSQGFLIGVVTGRGGGEFLDTYARFLNNTMFISSRWTASRFQFWGLMAPTSLGRSSFGQKFGIGTTETYLRRQAQKRILTGTAVAAGVLAMIEQLPGVEVVEWDWRSSKFGQFKLANGMWYDFMGGLEEPARLIARMAYGEGKSERGSFFSTAVDGINGPISSRVAPIFDYVTGRMPPAARLAAEYGGVLDRFSEAPGAINWDIPGTPLNLKRYIPLSIQSMADMWSEVNGPGDALSNAINSIALFLGEGVNPENPVSAWERDLMQNKRFEAELGQDKYLIHDDEPLSIDNLNKAGWEYVRNNPDLFGEKPTTMMKEWQETADKAERMRAGRRADQESDDAKLKAGTTSARDWRMTRSAARRQLTNDLQALYGEFPPSDPNSDDVIERYFAAIDANKHADTIGGGEIIDWDAVEEWEASLPASERRKLAAYFDEKAKQGTEMEQRYSAAMDMIEEAGYWDMRDEYFEQWKLTPAGVEAGAADFKSYDDWRRDHIEMRTEEIMANDLVPRHVAAEQAVKEGAGQFTKDFKADVMYSWVIENPEEAKALRDWGYYTPDKAAKDILAGRGSEEAEIATEAVVESRAAAALTKDMQAIEGYADWEATGWQAWAAKNLPGGATARSQSDYVDRATETRIAVEKQRLGRDLTRDEEAAIKAAASDEAANYTKSGAKATAAHVIRYVNASGKWTTGYMSQASLDQVVAIKAVWDTNPELARQAYAAGAVGFSSRDIGAAEWAWLKQNGVDLD